MLELLSVCREIAKIIKSVMAITELKKNGSKKEIQTRCKAFEALGVARTCFRYLLAIALGIFWLLLC